MPFPTASTAGNKQKATLLCAYKLWLFNKHAILEGAAENNTVPPADIENAEIISRKNNAQSKRALFTLAKNPIEKCCLSAVV